MDKNSTGAISSNKIPRLALLGCGAIAEDYYLPALARHPSLLANTILVDRDEEQLKKLTHIYQVKDVCTDYRQILGQVDGAILALPTSLHAPIGLDLLSRGLSILCEKPLAENAEKAKWMVDAAAKSGAGLATNYLGRLTPHFEQVKHDLEQQTFGKLLSIKYVIGEVFNWPTVSGFYFLSEPSSRGILRDRGAHAVDHICWWLGGKPNLLSSQNDSFGGSEAAANVEFEHAGCKGCLRLNWLVDVASRFVIQCEKATIEGDIYDYHKLLITQGGRTRELQLKTPIKTKTDIADRILTNFVDVILKVDAPLIPGSDVLNSVEFIDECYQKATQFRMPWYDLAEVTYAR